MDRSQRTFTNRRHLLKGGAALSGAAVVAAGLSPHTALAQEAGQSRLQQVLDRGKLVVGTGSTNPPWHYEDADGQLVGFDIDMAKLLARGLFELTDEQLANRDEWSQRLEFVVEAPDARIPNLLADKIDIVCQFMTVNPLRAQQVEFTIPYYREAVTLLFPADSPYTGTADITGQGATIAILENPDYGRHGPQRRARRRGLVFRLRRQLGPGARFRPRRSDGHRPFDGAVPDHAVT